MLLRVAIFLETRNCWFLFCPGHLLISVFNSLGHTSSFQSWGTHSTEFQGMYCLPLIKQTLLDTLHSTQNLLIKMNHCQSALIPGALVLHIKRADCHTLCGEKDRSDWPVLWQSCDSLSPGGASSCFEFHPATAFITRSCFSVATCFSDSSTTRNPVCLRARFAGSGLQTLSHHQLKNKLQAVLKKPFSLYSLLDLKGFPGW